MTLPADILELLSEIIDGRLHPAQSELDRFNRVDDDGCTLAMTVGHPIILSDDQMACCSRFLAMCNGEDVGVDIIQITFSRSTRTLHSVESEVHSEKQTERVGHLICIEKDKFTYVRYTTDEHLSVYSDNINHFESGCCSKSFRREEYSYNGTQWRGVLSGWNEVDDGWNDVDVRRRDIKPRPIEEFDPLLLLQAMHVDLSWNLSCYDKKGEVVTDYQEYLNHQLPDDEDLTDVDVGDVDLA